jgi:single-stranded-DNA-specific exonuclease
MLKPVLQQKITLRTADAALSDLFAKELKAPLVIGKLLALRNLATVDECKRFLAPNSSYFNDPFLFADMSKIVARIKAAIERKELIVIYGDYDVDGITSTVMLVRELSRLGAQCTYYLPNRLIEGYGLSEEGIRKIAEMGAKLVITVDCGVTACKEVALGNSLGMEIIVTDHHEPKESLPAAFAILDPKIPSCTYPDATLAGVGVALKVCHALALSNGEADKSWTDYLDLAAVGSAADIVPLTGENRIIANLGFNQLRTTKNAGLKALINAQGLGGKPLSTRDVVFQIAPCINAVGRLGDPRKSVELLLTNDLSLAANLAVELKQTNMERRAIDSAIQQEAFAMIERETGDDNDFAIVLGKRDWHCGVVGIVASKVVERYHRPAILFAINDDGTARGSGRSISAVNLHQALSQCGSTLESFGGHAAAAGMTIKESNIDQFRKCLNDAVKAAVTPDDLVPRIVADAAITVNDCTFALYTLIARMAPFGPGNMRPTFFCAGLRHKYDPRIVGSNHVKMMVADGRLSLDAVAFNFGHRFQEIKAAKEFSLAFTLDENEWNGRKNLQMKVRGIDL